MDTQKDILIIAGEPSGDLHGANLAQELWKLDPALTLRGLGGEKMLLSGVKLYFNIVELAGIGISEVFKNIARLRQVFKELVAIIEKAKPKAIVLIDFPEFNLRLAKEMHRLKIPIIYYISPQVWAWRRGRVKTISRYVKKMLVIFPFEEEFYRRLGISVEFVGHPLLDMAMPQKGKSMLKDVLQIEEDKVVIGLLPGSRESEVKKHLPVMLGTAKIIGRQIPRVQFVLPINSSLSEKFFTSMMNLNERVLVRLLPGQSSEVMGAADLVLVASGTATLEAARHSCPMVIIYKISFLTWLFVRPLIRVPYVGLVNLIAGKKIVPEYLQFQANPGRIARECLNLLKNDEKREEMVDNLRLVRHNLGEPGASEQAARAVLNIIRDKKITTEHTEKR
ncbi:MAG: lipid-A-disaccharide synthase [Candidatus Ratteibacteria bacterium]|nr:lipid-A-disaccharide synthase [Candidatus Ratteibacteria bacterium]